MAEPHDQVATPDCPLCEGPMTLRTNRRHGTSFWGCTSYPSCRGTRDVGQDPHESEGEDGTELREHVRVLWTDGTLDRMGWQCRYTTAGGRLRSSPALTALSNEFRQCWIARTSVNSVADEAVRRVTASVRKIIQRGSNPPIHPDAELEFLDSLGLSERVRPSALPGDLAVRLVPDTFHGLSTPSFGLPEPEFEADEGVRLESGHERQFVTEWARDNLGPNASRWFVPQASFDALTATIEGYGPSGRRVDFLVHPPFGTPFVVEIDGPQHEDSSDPDNERDHLLAQVGIEAVRIPTSELDQGHGPNLDRVKSLWPISRDTTDSRTARAAIAPVALHRLAVALLDAVDAGFLKGHEWVIELTDDLELSPSSIQPYLRLFNAMDRLWGPSMMPEHVFLRTGNGCTKFDIRNSARPMACEPPGTETHLVVRLESYLTAYDRLPYPGDHIPEIVVRSARLPVLVGDDLYEPDVRTNLDGIDLLDAQDALTEVLQAVFAKRGFREGQLRALLEVMEGRDCAVLLPTGGGKSLIYQMAGICKPGRTLVIDPLVALIEDQQRGLAEHGIDKVVGISSFQVAMGRLDTLLGQVAKGDALFILVAPERLQQSRFRNSIRSLAQATPINLAVVDEAHCVSEWGHQFRTSYLTLGRTLREVCRDSMDSPPPLLALTGTASRAVLKDVLVQLEMSTDAENAIVRPTTFARPELEMGARRCDPDELLSVLVGTLRGLPSRFGVPASEFFRPQADQTSSGLVFCPHTSGAHGTIELQRAIAGVVGFQPAIYSGGAPRERGRSIYGTVEWEHRKREFANSFKSNSVPLMVSTNAFGNGDRQAQHSIRRSLRHARFHRGLLPRSWTCRKGSRQGPLPPHLE